MKRPLPSEEKPIVKMGKKLVAARDLPAGHVLDGGRSRREVARRRGLPPAAIDALLGRVLARPLAEEQAILATDVSN